VLGPITTVPGSASACSRAARFGGSPITACSRARTLADQVADDHQPGGDPDAHLQRCPSRGIEPGHRLDQREPCPHRPLGVMLVGPRIAEIGEHAVAHVLRDETAAAFNDRSAAAVMGGDHRAQILRIEPRRQRRRADQIAEHHRQLPPPGFGSGGRHRRLGRLFGSRRRQSTFTQRCDRFQKLLARPERQPEGYEIGLGQLRQEISVDLILAEHPLVPRQPQVPQPRRNIHAALLQPEPFWRSESLI
jgi:hypothetical protein